jgi:enoyl-CoA hydratase/carnithine racemase
VIVLDRQDEVFVLRMQNGENRFNLDSVRELLDALDQVARAEGKAALVTVGEGKFFSNGLDLDWMMQVGAEKAGANVSEVHKLLGRVLTLPCFTVAAINGHAFAAGAMFALAHDARVMRTDRGFFCLPEVDIQMSFTPAMQALITARLPKLTAHEAMVTGRRYTAEQAVHKGIVDHTATEPEVLPQAIELARTHAKQNREPLATIKRDLYAQVLTEIARDTPLAPLRE